MLVKNVKRSVRLAPRYKGTIVNHTNDSNVALIKKIYNHLGMHATFACNVNPTSRVFLVEMKIYLTENIQIHFTGLQIKKSMINVAPVPGKKSNIKNIGNFTVVLGLIIIMFVPGAFLSRLLRPCRPSRP